MTWTGRPDNEPCCGDAPGAVACEEDVVRLLHCRILEPDQAAFTRSDLVPNSAAPSNVCGEADGCSVDRSTGMTDDEIRARAVAQAEKKPGREGRGGLVASVAALRSITHPDAPGGAVRVYDDPRADNDRHAVIRLSEGIPRSDFSQIRRALINAFGRRVA